MDFGLIFGICVVAAGIYVALKLVSINRGGRRPVFVATPIFIVKQTD